MTPHELNLHIEAYSERLRQEQNDGITLAYLGAYWNRVKRMPGLNNILGKTEKKIEQTPEQMLAAVKAMHAAMGGETKTG